jgi:hypothetical protein
MKKKYTYLMSIGMMILAVGIAGLWFAYGQPNGDRRAAQHRLPPMPTINMPSPQTMAEIERFNGRLNRLATVDATEQAAPDLRLLGYRLHESYTPATDTGNEYRPVAIEYSLTFAFASAKKRYCMINGTFYREGDRLPDGGHILKVKANRILIEKEGFKQWVPMDRTKPADKEKREIVAKPS